MMKLRTSITLGVVWWSIAVGFSSADARTKAKPPHPHKAAAERAAVNAQDTDKATAAALRESYRLEAAGDCKAAADALDEKATDPHSKYFLKVRLAYLQLCARDYAKAAVSYAEAATLDHAGIEALLGQQQALLALPRYKEAEAVGAELVRRDPNNYLANSRLAWTLFNLKQYARSVVAYERLVTLYPADVEMRLGLGWAFLRGGKRAAATEQFKRVLDMVPDNARAQEGLRAAAKD